MIDHTLECQLLNSDGVTAGIERAGGDRGEVFADHLQGSSGEACGIRYVGWPRQCL